MDDSTEVFAKVYHDYTDVKCGEKQNQACKTFVALMLKCDIWHADCCIIDGTMQLLITKKLLGKKRYQITYCVFYIVWMYVHCIALQHSHVH